MLSGNLPEGKDCEMVKGDNIYVLPLNAAGMHYVGLAIANLGMFRLILGY